MIEKVACPQLIACQVYALISTHDIKVIFILLYMKYIFDLLMYVFNYCINDIQ